jgi:hypothetical protein
MTNQFLVSLLLTLYETHEEKTVARVEPLEAGADGQDLARSDNEVVVTAAERTETNA